MEHLKSALNLTLLSSTYKKVASCLGDENILCNFNIAYQAMAMKQSNSNMRILIEKCFELFEDPSPSQQHFFSACTITLDIFCELEKRE
jgi:hypothetical protein